MFITEKLYIEDSKSLQDRLDRIDSIILALENRLLNSAADTSDKKSYQLNDGQVTIFTEYRSVGDIANAITKYDIIRQRLINKLNGNQMTLRPWQGNR